MSDTKGVKSVLLVSQKLRSITTLQNAVLEDAVAFVHFRHEIGFQGILDILSSCLDGHRVVNIAIVLYSTPFAVYICSNEGKMQQITRDALSSPDSELKDFFVKLCEEFLLQEPHNALCRLHLLSCNLADTLEGKEVYDCLNTIIQPVKCDLSKDLWGSDLEYDEDGYVKRVSDLYFQPDKVHSFSASQTMEGFERIRTVGKGAYGTAVLYKKKDDDSLVILKEINMHDLSAAERQLALNEIKVLSMLDHPNIVGYYDSFEDDGILMIEMEYADGGTLSQLLVEQQQPLDEKEVLSMFQQIVAAIHYIHERKVLHRDLKTANIFLTKENIIKVGDFGIAKLMSTSKNGANTVLGTPYYISPEMCEGKEYNEKSDVWALGCILYEMACLQRTFEGSNLPALVNKIMKGHFAPVKGNYSEEFKALIQMMLQREPQERPTTEEILYQQLPKLMKRYEDPSTDIEDDSNSSHNGSFMKKRLRPQKEAKRSVLYEMDLSNLNLTPVNLPSKIRLKQVATGLSHVVVVTGERIVYSWGDNTSGQLGLGDFTSRQRPTLIDALRSKSICRVACGDKFSVFGSENGIVMTCGDGRNGCLGHSDWQTTNRPKLIESLLSVDVTCITAGSCHVVAVSSDGTSVYTWGCGDSGRLGLGNEETYCEPSVISLREPVIVRNAYACNDATMLLTDMGAVFASGCNTENKLGLNIRQGFLMAMKKRSSQSEVHGVLQFTCVRALSRHKVLSISMSTHHTAVLVDNGHVITVGRNTEGQLGGGNTRPQHAVCVDVRGALQGKLCQRVQCGPHYSLASTLTNELFFWGRRRVNTNNTTSTQSTPSDKIPTTADGVLQSNKVNNDEDGSSYEVYPLPVVILKLSNSDDVDHSAGDRETVMLSNFLCSKENFLLVQVETTAPVPVAPSSARSKSRRQSHTRRGTPEREHTSPRHRPPSSTVDSPISLRTSENGNEASSEGSSSYDTLGPIPLWLKAELQESSPEHSSHQRPKSTISPAQTNRSGSHQLTENNIPQIQVKRDHDVESGVSRVRYSIRTDALHPSKSVSVTPVSPHSRDDSPSQRTESTDRSSRHRQSSESARTSRPSTAKYLPQPMTPNPRNHTASHRPHTAAVSRAFSTPFANSTRANSRDQAGLRPSTASVMRTESAHEMDGIYGSEATRENQLQKELAQLKKELRDSQKMLQENNNVIRRLQEQIGRLQREQSRISNQVTRYPPPQTSVSTTAANNAPTNNTAGKASKPESKICALQ